MEVMKNIKAVVFDLDDTLILEKDYIKSGLKKISNIFREKYNFNSDLIFNEMLELVSKNESNIFNKILDSYHIEYSKKDIIYLVDEYRNHSPNISLLNDAKKTLNWLIKNNYKLGIITDGYKETQRKKIKALGLNMIIDEIIITDELGKKYWKPNKYPYILIKQRLNISFNEFIYVGDNPNKDFISAKELGIKTFKIVRKDGVYYDIKKPKEYEADYKITSLTELIKYLGGNL